MASNYTKNTVTVKAEGKRGEHSCYHEILWSNFYAAFLMLFEMPLLPPESLCPVLANIYSSSLQNTNYLYCLKFDRNKSELGAGMNPRAVLVLVQDCRFWHPVRVNSLDKSEQQDTDSSSVPDVCVPPKAELTKAEPTEHSCERRAARWCAQHSHWTSSSVTGYAEVPTTPVFRLQDDELWKWNPTCLGINKIRLKEDFQEISVSEEGLTALWN